MTEPVAPPLTARGPLPSAAPSRVGAILRLLRPAHWTKNILVFVAPGAAGSLVHSAVVLRSIGTFIVFCAAASATYCLNDVIDAPRDRVHPVKRHRPVAAGRISPAFAAGVALPLCTGALIGSWFVGGWRLAAVVAVYVMVTLSYSLWLKRYPVIELAAVAAGFLLRAIAGGVAVNVPLSEWFLLVTSFGALFLVVGKRAGEQETLGSDRARHRETLSLYTPEFLRSALTLAAAACVTTYCMWAFGGGHSLAHRGDHLVWIELSVAPVVVGVLYVLRLLGDGRGEAPTSLALHDRTLQVLGVVWALLVCVGVYG